MDKWEYKEFTETFWDLKNDWLDFLNIKGQEGWELISYTAWSDTCKVVYRTCLFKRKIQQEHGNRSIL